jgi:hypothetical protein
MKWRRILLIAVTVSAWGIPSAIAEVKPGRNIRLLDGRLYVDNEWVFLKIGKVLRDFGSPETCDAFIREIPLLKRKHYNCIEINCYWQFYDKDGDGVVDVSLEPLSKVIRELDAAGIFPAISTEIYGVGGGTVPAGFWKRHPEAIAVNHRGEKVMDTEYGFGSAVPSLFSPDYLKASRDFIRNLTAGLPHELLLHYETSVEPQFIGNQALDFSSHAKKAWEARRKDHKNAPPWPAAFPVDSTFLKNEEWNNFRAEALADWVNGDAAAYRSVAGPDALVAVDYLETDGPEMPFRNGDSRRFLAKLDCADIIQVNWHWHLRTRSPNQVAYDNVRAVMKITRRDWAISEHMTFNGSDYSPEEAPAMLRNTLKQGTRFGWEFVNVAPNSDDPFTVYNTDWSPKPLMAVVDNQWAMWLQEIYGHQKPAPRVPYNNPGLAVDLGVGLWAHPLPMDYDGDGDYDLVVSTADKPYNGVYFFENPGGVFPVFKPGVWLAPGEKQLTVSHTDAGPVVSAYRKTYPRFTETALDHPEAIPFKPGFHEGRARQYRFADYNGDGMLDLIMGISDWREYGWDNAFNEKGEWTRGPLHGYVYAALNRGTNGEPEYAEEVHVMAGGEPVDVYGAPSPCFADFDGDGDLDLICGEFLDKLTWFENTGTRTEPVYAAGRYLENNGEVIRMDLEMLQVVSLDWDRDGDIDLIVGQEDGRVAWWEHTGEVRDSMPVFAKPRFFRQEAESLKTGALAAPFSFDWDGDGDEDIIAGDTAGYINFVENLDGGDPPSWAAPVYLQAGGETIRIQAGPNGSIQGPAEAKWGYTVLNVADWNHDGLPDIVINSILGRVEWFENIGTRTAPELAAAQPIEVAWEGETPKPAWFWWNPEGDDLVTQWRTSPVVIDLNRDSLNDLVMLDQEGYLAFFEREKTADGLRLLPPQRIFEDEKGGPLRLTSRKAGGSGRRKFIFTDWDGDGMLDILINSRNIDFMRNIAEEPGQFRFRNEGQLSTRYLAGHTTCPAITDWDRDGVPDLLIGAEDGFYYYRRNTR